MTENRQPTPAIGRTSDAQEVTIIGGGIGGLALAVSLAQSGIESEVYEGSDEARQRTTGAFLNLAPNGMRALDYIGVAEAVETAGSPSSGIEFLSSDGRSISRLDASHERQEFGFSNTMIRRADLHGILLDAASAHAVTIEWQRRVSTITETDTRVTMQFDDRTTQSAETVIGADGVRSAVRQHVLGEKAPDPNYLGLIDVAGFCRSVPAGIVQGPQRMVFGRHGFFAYYATPTGEIWWFANIPHRGPPTPTDVGRYTGDSWRKVLLDLFADDVPIIGEILAGSDDPVGAWPITDLATLPTWHTPRVCLIGDAAHASSPSAGQGASLAIEDAVVLAALIAKHGPGQQAFASLEQQRQERTRLAVRTARRNTSSKAAGPITARIRDLILPRLLRSGAKQTASFMHWEPPTRLSPTHPAKDPQS